MPRIHEYRLTVTEEDLDDQGHVNNVEFLRWMQSAAIEHSEVQGWPASRYRRLGAGWVVRSHSITYRQPAFRGDEIAVFTWVSSFRRVLSLRRYKIVRVEGRTELAVAETEWAFVDLASRSPARIPADLLAAFEEVSENEEP